MKKPDLFWQKKCLQKKYSHCKCRKRKTTLAFSCGVPYLHFQLSKTHLVRFEDTRVSITSNPNTVSKLKRYLKMFLWLCLCFHKSTLLFAISVNTVVTAFSESHRLWEKQQVLIYYKSKDLLIAFFSQIFPPKKNIPALIPSSMTSQDAKIFLHVLQRYLSPCMISQVSNIAGQPIFSSFIGLPFLLRRVF